MAGFDPKRHWWIPVTVVAVLAVATLAIADQWLPDLRNATAFVVFGLIGAMFCWVYAMDTEHLWWAIIPGLGLFTFLAAMVADALIGTDPENDWVSVLVIAAGAAIIAAVLKRADARLALVAVATITLIVGIAMAPLVAVVKGVPLIAAAVAFGLYYIWYSSSQGTSVRPS